MDPISAILGAGVLYICGYGVLVLGSNVATNRGQVKQAAKILDIAVSINPRPVTALITRSALRLNHLQDYEGAIPRLQSNIEAQG